jgi:hypothetical protein
VKEAKKRKEKKRKGKEERDGKERKVTVVWFENNFQIFQKLFYIHGFKLIGEIKKVTPQYSL